MDLIAKLTWNHRANWLAMIILTAFSALVTITVLQQGVADVEFVKAGGSSMAPLAYFGAGVTLLVVMLVVKSIAALCLEGQSRDLAVLRTCGASPRQTRRLLYGEVALVTAAGVTIGVILSLFFTNLYINFFYHTVDGSNITTFGNRFLPIASGYVFIIAVVLFGARKTIKKVSLQNIVDAMHGEQTRSKKSPVATITIAVLLLLVVGGIWLYSTFFTGTVKTLSMSEAFDAATAGPGLVFAAGIGTMAALVALGPILFRAILSALTALKPKRAPASLDVGLGLARLNSGKFPGSITPIIVFTSLCVLFVGGLETIKPGMSALYEAYGQAAPEFNPEAYGQALFMFGPALSIAVIAALCTIVMSGSGRQFVNRLSGVIGAKTRTVLMQNIVEILAYTTVAALCSALVMVVTSGVGSALFSRLTQLPIAPVFPWHVLGSGLLVGVAMMSIPVVIHLIRSRRIASKVILQTFDT